MEIAALVFDLDGTLVDSAADIAEAVNRMLDDLALPRVEEAVVRSWIGEGVRNLVDTALHHAGSERTLGEVMPGFMHHYHDCSLRSPRLYDGVAEALRLLQAACRWRSAPTAIGAGAAVAGDGIAPYFAHIVGGDTLPQRKPAPEPLLHAAQLLGHAVSNC